MTVIFVPALLPSDLLSLRCFLPPFCQAWPARKEQLPYKQCPVLQWKGVMIAQSSSIVRFLAREFHFDGDTDLERALIDMGFEAMIDIRKAYWAMRGDEATKAEFYRDFLPKHAKLLEDNIRGKPWYCGARFSYVDVGIYYGVSMWHREPGFGQNEVPKMMKMLPKIQAIHDEMCKNEVLMNYVKNRKETPF
jgi:glutathione S-transferase